VTSAPKRGPLGSMSICGIPSGFWRVTDARGAPASRIIGCHNDVRSRRAVTVDGRPVSLPDRSGHDRWGDGFSRPTGC